jgi:Fe(3+) dicitrate transport protein
MGTLWNVAALILDTKLTAHLTLNTKLFGLMGERNSVGFTATPNNVDAIDSTTKDYAKRQVDRDFYKNLGIETRSIYSYKLGKQNQNLAFGARLYRANTTRKQAKNGTTASDFDIEIDGRFSRDLEFKTDNIALFAENQFKINSHLSITPGIRYENVKSSIDGRLGINSDTGNDYNVTPESLTRNKILMGIGVEYKLNKTNFYANFSQAFRPVLFSDITPPTTNDVIDKNLKDADGFNLDFGYRGNLLGWINFDVGCFYLNYDNKIGLLRKFVNDPTPRIYQFRTNLGTAIHKGIESFVDLNISKALKVNRQIGDLQLFTTISFIDARYEDYKVTKPSETEPNVLIESNLKGNRVENAPRYIHNFGLTWSYKSFSSTLQNRRTGKVYSDANNTESPNATGVTGKLDGYSVYDLSMEYRFLQKFNIRGGINNLSNVIYATRRAGGYPGPGILPNDARTFFVSVGVKL